MAIMQRTIDFFLPYYSFNPNPSVSSTAKSPFVFSETLCETIHPRECFL